MTLVRRIERSHDVDAWVGDQERLDRLVRVLEDLVEKGEALAVDDDPIDLVATATESGSVTLRGTPAEVFREMDRQALHNLELEVSRAYPVNKRDQVRITFDRIEGLKIESRGESAWVDDSHRRLEEEVERGKPWWYWLRGIPGGAIVLFLGWGYFAVLVWNSAYGQDEGNEFVTKALAIGLGGIMVAGLATSVVMGVIRRILPGFEVVRPGEKGRGARALAVAGTLVVAAFGVVLDVTIS